MRSNGHWLVTLAFLVGAFVSGTGSSFAATSDEAAKAETMMSSYEAQQNAAAAAREKDPAWKPACQEIASIQVGDAKKPGALKNFCLNTDGNILACFAGGKSGSTKADSGIRVYSPKGELVKTLPLELSPCAICVGKDGMIYVAGEGRLLKLNQAGKVLASADSPVAQEPVVISKEVEEMVNEMAKQNRRPASEEMDRMKASLERRRSDITGLAVTDQDVFMACPAPNDFSYRVYRFDHELQNSKLIVEKLRGCCGQMDIQAHEGNLWIPHNARHRVECWDRDGKEILKFGKPGRVKANEFGGCCEPKNVRILPNGEILAAESGPPTCIKRFAADGKFLGVVAVLKSKGDCVRVTVEMSADGKCYYMLDTARDAIRVFGAKS